MHGLTRLGAWPAGLVQMLAQEALFQFFTVAMQKLTLMYVWVAAYAEKPVLLVAFFLLSGR